MDNNQWEFRFYRSGSHVGDFIFNKEEIQYRMKNIETGEWPPFGRFEPAPDTNDILAPSVLQRLCETEGIDWSERDEIALDSGKRYSRYMKIEGSVDGQKNEAWIWAMRGSGLPIDIIESSGSIIGFIMTARDRCNMLVKAGYEDLTPLKLWNDPLASKDIYNIKDIGTYHIITRDGASLATEVWLPCPLEDSKKYPAVLIRTPYGRFSSIDFIRNYADKYHHRKEEDRLFNIMAEQLGLGVESGPIAGMLVEHNLGRAHVIDLEKALKECEMGNTDARVDVIANAIGYEQMLLKHIEKEDNAIYRYAEKHLSKVTLEKLDAEFEAVEQDGGNTAIREKYTELAKAFGGSI